MAARPWTTLEALPPGSRARVVNINAPGRWSYRLLQMGFIPGAIIEIVVNNGVGPILVRIMGITISLGRGIARRILVEPI
ncbi:MAG: ferrous iron transport protein A [Desulfurococcales archaeon]|nr:ferrous iron transport protein A [Desulfurococcales archaeon]